jgi:Skp family chaperone for outer membrane proteins
MRKFSLIAVTLIFAAFLAVSASAQTGDKIGLIAWDAFEDQTKGIKRYAAAIAAVDKEFEPINLELRTMITKYQALQTEIQNLQKQLAGTGTVPVNQTALQTSINAKVDELGQLERDIKKKQEDAKAKYQSRFNTVVGPIQADIYKALSEYAEKNGYAVILDGAKLEQAGVLLGFAPKANITDAFITFYNARPATTAAR